jgi:glycosidase
MEKIMKLAKIINREKIKSTYLILVSVLILSSCEQNKQQAVVPETAEAKVVSHAKNNAKPAQTNQGKPVIYQVFTRLFGNQNTTNKPWGTIEENGVGKFNDFDQMALKKIKEFGVSHIWYTGVPHHAVIRDYTQYGISLDDPDVVKGRAGSPYAVKDYYNVNPDLAVDPEKRLEEFEKLIERTHQQGMKVMIDIVPNHVARNYQSISKPEGVADFGVNDDTSVEYKRDNNFYYIVGQSFKVPESKNGYKPLNGEPHPMSDNQFDETPAKWTGNGARKVQPDINDWYETVKVNYGVKPDGSYDFARLPKDYANKDYQAHFAFWQNKTVPDSWKKFHDIVLYWIDKGVDGFRYDMAEMVPVEFWSYLNSAIKMKNPEATLLAEVYNPSLYRDYIDLGKMDLLYDKVDFYDTMKLIMQGKSTTSALLPIVERFSDIDDHLLHFLENHDEQRIASADFAGDANKGKPAMVVSSLIGKGPNLLYFAQALGEPGDGDAGFGDPTRTTIFDYWGVASLQRWHNGGKFDGGQSTVQEKELRQFYVELMDFSAKNSAFNGEFMQLHSHNLQSSENYTESVFSFARWDQNNRVVVVSNFSDSNSVNTQLKLPKQLVSQWQLQAGTKLVNQLFEQTKQPAAVNVDDAGQASISVNLKPLESKLFYWNN